MSQEIRQSPPWNRNFKLIVVLIIIIFFTLIMYQFRNLISYFVISSIFAYLVNPVVTFLAGKFRLKRPFSILFVYVTLLILLITTLIGLIVVGVTQVNSLLHQLPNIIDGVISWITYWIGRPFTFGPIHYEPTQIDWSNLEKELISEAQASWNTVLDKVLTGGTGVVGNVAQVTLSTISGLGTVLFIFVMAVYISFDIPKFGKVLGDIAHFPGYRQDAERFMREFGRIWQAYLRGQIILSLVMGVTVWIVLTILGVENALVLGLLSGLVEFLPVLGPLIGGGVAVLVAVFQPDNWMGLNSIHYGLLITSVMFMLQQLENNFLVPRIVGDALDLHPLITMFAVIIGASWAGILGAILATPVAATLKLLLSYTWRKLFDYPPFPTVEQRDEGNSFLKVVFEKGNEYLKVIRKRVQSQPSQKSS